MPLYSFQEIVLLYFIIALLEWHPCLFNYQFAIACYNLLYTYFCIFYNNIGEGYGTPSPNSISPCISKNKKNSKTELDLSRKRFYNIFPLQISCCDFKILSVFFSLSLSINHVDFLQTSSILELLNLGKSNQIAISI